MPSLRTPLAVLALLAPLAAMSCSTGTAPIPQDPPGSPPPCSPGAQVQMSSPLAGSQGNPSNLTRIQIVANASSDVLGKNWNITLLDYSGNLAQSGLLSPAGAPGTYKPFATNFYYNAAAPPLFANDVYKVYLNKSTSSCQPLYIGAFSV